MTGIRMGIRMNAAFSGLMSHGLGIGGVRTIESYLVPDLVWARVCVSKYLVHTSAVPST